jgi:ElaB/YqjD/DUF883 family membrane-anchored ribosome-binding protein
MPTRGTGRRRSHARHAARTPMEAAVRVADDEARTLVAAVEDIVEHLATVADPKVQRLRRRAEAALHRAKAAVAEGGAQVQERVGDLAYLAEPADGHSRRWALLGVAVVCAIAIGLWTGRAVMSE